MTHFSFVFLLTKTALVAVSLPCFCRAVAVIDSVRNRGTQGQLFAIGTLLYCLTHYLLFCISTKRR